MSFLKINTFVIKINNKYNKNELSATTEILLSLTGAANVTKNIIVNKPNKCFTYMLLFNSSCSLHGTSAKKLPEIIRINIKIVKIFVSVMI